jgi:hypothetical protein
MSQNDFNIANQGFPATRADINSALQALASNSAGTAEPSTTYAYQFWYDETNELLKMRNSDNDAWITLAAFDQATDEWEVRTAVVQAVDNAGISFKTDDGVTRLAISDSGAVTISSLNYPTSDGTNGQVLTTDGSGNITFEDAGSGAVLQVVSTTKTDTFSTTSSSYTDVTGLSVSITPTSATSKILVLTNVNLSGSTRYHGMQLVRNSTAIGIGDASSVRSRVTVAAFSNEDNSSDAFIMKNVSASFLDAPSTTSSTTYKVQVRYLWTGTQTTYVNRAPNDGDAAYSSRGISTITVMEIAG